MVLNHFHNFTQELRKINSTILIMYSLKIATYYVPSIELHVMNDNSLHNIDDSPDTHA